ncbi:DUF4350 domain-containing protein [Luteolibacter sp. Populi]|uniref:DUF4350 domain-containing protein n=1 Tax=Luteolibacter sp. Populi TaxID=3230487 RepID=UPI003466C39C
MIRCLLLLLCLLVAGCTDYGPPIWKEIGYKGKARLNAYLAAGRFLERYGYTVESPAGWPDLESGAAMLIVPAAVISNESYVREISNWVAQGGHLLCLIDNAESHQDDWGNFSNRHLSRDERLPSSFEKWLAAMKLELGERGAASGKTTAERLNVDGESYEVFAESSTTVSAFGAPDAVFGQSAYGEGLITVMTDARPFRNRFISDHDHAAFLLALVKQNPFEGRIIVVRDAVQSLSDLLWRHAWPALIGLLVLTLFWLWKNMPRFGPLRREEGRTTMRDYDHHLEALGDFQWRLDRGAAMLRPLRESVLERAQRLAAIAQREDDLFAWIGERAGIGRERAERAMTHERPADGTSFTRVIADLQKIHLSLS